MTPRQSSMLVALAAIWGSSFLFIRVAVEELGPAALTELRVALAAAAVAVLVRLRGGRPALRERAGGFLLIGLLGAALPFALIAIAELELPASLASILNATPPLWAALIAAAFLGERFTARLALGLALALAGVALVVGLAPVVVDAAFVLAAAAMLLSGLLYGAIGHVIARRMQGIEPLTMVVGQQGAAALLLLPAVAVFPPAKAPSIGHWGAVLALGLLCTALAFVLFFGLISEIGATRTLTVTFLVPVFGVLWGALFLGEEIRALQGVGALVLLGGVLLVVSRPPAVGVPAS